jgi:hypothetical protein
LDDSAAWPAQRGQEGVDHGEAGEDVDLELVPDSGDRKHLERAGREDPGIAYEDVQTRLAQRLGDSAHPRLDRALISNVRDGVGYLAARSRGYFHRGCLLA